MLFVIGSLFVILLTLCIVYVKYKHNHWTRIGVLQNDPTFFLGHVANITFKIKCQGENVQDIYNAHPSSRCVGVYQFLQPTLLVRDPELIRRITVKDFEHFTDHRVFTEEVSKSRFWGQNVFSLKGEKWKEMRATISPGFTSSKMKLLFCLINECSENFTNYFVNKTKNTISVDAKDVFARYTNDVIAITTFGVACNSLVEPNNEVFLMGEKGSQMVGGVKVFLYAILPQLAKALNLRLFSEEYTNFFKTLITQAIDLRERNNIIRPDLIHILMQAKKGELKTDDDQPETDTLGMKADFYQKFTKKYAITDLDIIAQCLVFFFAGFDTASRMMSYACYELALNPGIQKRAREEIRRVLQENNGELTYESVVGLKYIETILLESLRKYPPVVNLDRNCTRPYTIEPTHPGEKPIHVRKDDVIWIPVFAIHRNPQYYPNPETFDPERFNDVNRKHIKPYTFIPFGAGPRFCIGERFALLEGKVMFAHLLTKFEVIMVEKTEIPLKFTPTSVNLDVEGGIYVGFKRIPDE